jgi:hypothetical protein
MDAPAHDKDRIPLFFWNFLDQLLAHGSITFILLPIGVTKGDRSVNLIVKEERTGCRSFLKL